jgi:beta-glucosidase/6-phospho-beta-glucosidase/beta-galactosidase
MAKQLGEAAAFWLTINEPAVVPAGQYLMGMFPPQHTDFAEFVTSTRHILVALGRCTTRSGERAAQPAGWAGAEHDAGHAGKRPPDGPPGGH